METTIEINGQTYTKQNANFKRQRDRVLNSLGSEMLGALQDVGAIIAGGAVLSAFTQAEINDIDVYFDNREDLVEAFVKVTKDWEGLYLGHTDKSITLKDRETEAIVQFIYFDYFQNAEKVFEAFDFTVCMAAIELKGEDKEAELVLHPDFLSDVASRTLHFNNGTRFPYISLIRTKKYQEKGYKIGRGNILAISMACANYPINDWNDAKEQLGGVYGNQIEIEVQDGREFSTEALYEVVTNIRDDLPPINHSDYEALWQDLTHTSYGSSEAEQFAKDVWKENV